MNTATAAGGSGMMYLLLAIVVSTLCLNREGDCRYSLPMPKSLMVHGLQQDDYRQHHQQREHKRQMKQQRERRTQQQQRTDRETNDKLNSNETTKQHHQHEPQLLKVLDSSLQAITSFQESTQQRRLQSHSRQLQQSCSCAPRSFTVTLDLFNTCNDDTVEGNGGIANTACTIEVGDPGLMSLVLGGGNGGLQDVLSDLLVGTSTADKEEEVTLEIVDDGDADEM